MSNRPIDTASFRSIQKASEILFKGKVLVFPTDTVYGIGCLPKEKAIRKLYKIKNRPLNQPTAILFSKKLYKLLDTKVKSQTPKNIYKDFQKGKITLILPKSQIKFNFPNIILKDETIGLRIPKNVWLQKLIDVVGPIVASSANKRGERAPKKFAGISQDIIEGADLVVKIEKSLSGEPSAVYDLACQKYLRQ